MIKKQLTLLLNLSHQTFSTKILKSVPFALKEIFIEPVQNQMEQVHSHVQRIYGWSEIAGNVVLYKYTAAVEG